MARTRKYMHGRKRRFSPLKQDNEIKDDIGYMPGDSDMNSNIPFDKDIIRQHILNNPGDDRRGRGVERSEDYKLYLKGEKQKNIEV